MFKFNKKIIIISLVGILISGFLVWDYFNRIEKVRAGTSQNVSGWAWAELAGRGWISFNSTNCDVNGNGTYEGTSEGAPAACPSSGTVYSYGVNIDPTSYELSGQAWSENLGWISFNRSETGTPPDIPYNGTETYIAKLDTTDNYKLKGWARALTACKDNNWSGTACTASTAGDKAGGWDGWIKLTGDVQGGGTYGVTLNTTTTPKEFTGWAWGGNSADPSTKGVIGWLAFNDNSDGTTGPYDYQVTTTLTFGPTCSNTSESWNYCDDSHQPWLNWSCSETQTGRQIQITSWADSNFVSPLVDYTDTSLETGSLTFYHNTSYTTSWNTSYRWRVKCQSSTGWSGWATDSDGFTTPLNAYPSANFTYSPTTIRTNEFAQFQDTSTCSDSDNTCNSWNWTFEKATTCCLCECADDACLDSSDTCTKQGTSGDKIGVKWKYYPTTARGYTTTGKVRVTLQACDVNPYCCSKTYDITTIRYPSWKEITPW